MLDAWVYILLQKAILVPRVSKRVLEGLSRLANAGLEATRLAFA